MFFCRSIREIVGLSIGLNLFYIVGLGVSGARISRVLFA